MFQKSGLNAMDAADTNTMVNVCLQCNKLTGKHTPEAGLVEVDVMCCSSVDIVGYVNGVYHLC